MMSINRLINPLRASFNQADRVLYTKISALQTQPSRNFIIELRDGPVEMKFEDNRDYGIYALTSGYVIEGAIEATRLAVTRAIKSKDLKQITADFPITKKPEGSRMGKGKGKVSYYVKRVAAGELMFEFNCEDETLAAEAFRQANFKLPLRVYLRKKPAMPRKKLSIAELNAMYKLGNDKSL